MANSITIRKFVDGTKFLIVSVAFNCDTTAEFTGQLISDPNGSGAGDPVPTWPAGARFTIEEIWYNVNNFDVQLQFDASTVTKIFALPHTGGDSHLDFRCFGGIKDPGGSGSTGKLTLTTVGVTANTSMGQLIIKMRKD